jgi:hypothetical protein
LKFGVYYGLNKAMAIWFFVQQMFQSDVEVEHLTRQVLMNWHAYKSILRIGVAAETGNLEAQAWIEYQGLLFIGNLQDLAHFIPLPLLEGVKI